MLLVLCFEPLRTHHWPTAEPRSDEFPESLAGFETKADKELSDFCQRHQRDADKKTQVAADLRDQLDGRLLPPNRLHRFERGLKRQKYAGTTRHTVRYIVHIAFPIRG